MPRKNIEQIFDKMIAFKSASCYNGHIEKIVQEAIYGYQETD